MEKELGLFLKKSNLIDSDLMKKDDEYLSDVMDFLPELYDEVLSGRGDATFATSLINEFYTDHSDKILTYSQLGKIEEEIQKFIDAA